MLFITVCLFVLESSVANEEDYSYVVLPLEYDLQNISANLNEKHLGEEFDIGNKKNNLTGLMKIDGNIIVNEGKENSINIVIPVSGKATKRWTQMLLGKRITIAKASTNFSSNLNLNLTPKLAEDWTLPLDPKTKHVWTKKPKTLCVLRNLCILPLEGALKERIEKIEEKISKKIEEKIPDIKFKEKIKEKWESLQQPKKISGNGSYELYLMFSPTGIGHTGIKVIDGKLKDKILIIGSPTAKFGEQDKINPSPLPSFGKAQHLKNDFNINIPIRMTKKHLLNALNAKMDQSVLGVNKDIGEDEGVDGYISNAEIKKIEIINNDVVIHLTASGGISAIKLQNY